jgi:3-oxoacyl-[acyl-carrier protein] reductase
MDLGLEDKVIFVAGSSRGIGKGIASVFLTEGARVVLTGRDQTTLAAAEQEISHGRADRLMTFAGDLTQTPVVEEAYRRVAARWGAIDGLICNIGSGAAKNDWRLTIADWEPVFEINLWAAVGIVQIFLPGMVDRKRGNIVLISSIAGLESLGAPLPYGAAKAALGHYAKDLARRVGRYGVRVNTVAPGNILSPGGTWDRRLSADPAAVNAMIAAEVPLGRFAVPEEIGAAVAFLASDCAAFITGACLVADGGQTRAC